MAANKHINPRIMRMMLTSDLPTKEIAQELGCSIQCIYDCHRLFKNKEEIRRRITKYKNKIKEYEELLVYTDKIREKRRSKHGNRYQTNNRRREERSNNPSV